MDTDFGEKSQDYAVLLDLVARLIDSRAGQEIPEGAAWLNDAQTLSVKLFKHLASMAVLASVTTFQYEKAAPIQFIDHSSLQVVARAALETYLVFSYLYASPDSAACEFRHKTWKLAGLLDRQEFHVSNEENARILAKEKRTIDELSAEIKGAPQFQAYTTKQQVQLLAGNWRVGNSWSDLSVQAGVHKKYFDNIYSYLCGYSHANYLSALQVGQAQSLNDQRMLSEHSAGIGLFIMSRFSSTYTALFPAALAVLTLNEEARQLAETYRFDAKDMEAIYDR